jgi:tetratricopeptide (TPR) repeat protein
MKYLLPLLILASCSSRPDKSTSKAPDQITNEDFKKERALTRKEVADFYQGSAASLSPALQDETVDRYSQDELKKITTFSDPLMEISIRCSRRDFDTAFAVAAKNSSRYQKIATYWNQIANCHLNQGNERKALLFYNKALEVRKNYVPALNNIGVMYSRQGEDQKALVAFERANKIGKFSKTPRYNLAKLHLKYGLADSALPIFQSLLNVAPNDIDILNAVGSSYFLLSDYGRALSFYQKIPQSEWRNAEIGLNLAVTLKKLGQHSDAEKVFNLVDKPSSSGLKNYYAVVKAQLGDAK